MDLRILSVFALVNILAALVFVVAAFWAVDAIRWENFVKDPHSRRTHTLRALFALALAAVLSCFFAQYLLWSWDLRYLFGG